MHDTKRGPIFSCIAFQVSPIKVGLDLINHDIFIALLSRIKYCTIAIDMRCICSVLIS